MEEMQEDDLASAGSRLIMPNLGLCDLTESWAVAIVIAASESGQRRWLQLSGWTLSHLPQVQAKHMVKAMSTFSCNIRRLDICLNDLSHVDHTEHARDVNNLEKVVPHSTGIKWDSILEEI